LVVDDFLQRRPQTRSNPELRIGTQTQDNAIVSQNSVAGYFDRKMKSMPATTLADSHNSSVRIFHAKPTDLELARQAVVEVHKRKLTDDSTLLEFLSDPCRYLLLAVQQEPCWEACMGTLCGIPIAAHRNSCSTKSMCVPSIVIRVWGKRWSEVLSTKQRLRERLRYGF